MNFKEEFLIVYRCVTDYLSKTVRIYGDKVIFQDKENQITFKQFNELSGSVASKIIELNLFEEPILILTQRNVMTPVCHVGVARSGCFYVPMDASNPINRLQQIIDIADSKVMIIDRENADKLDKLEFHGKVLFVDEIVAQPANNKSVRVVESKINGNMPLYVIFTSGSTGIPKGVTTSHHSVMCYIDAVTKVMNISNDDVLGNQSPMDYIAAVRDIYIPIKTGATTYIIPENEFAIPTDLLETINQNKISTICWSAAGLELCVKTGLFECGIPQGIKKVLFSGSILSGKALKTWQCALPNALFVNQYGPTEATASCTYHVVKEQASDNTVLPIGIPYDNYKVFLVDEFEKEVPHGDVGEICVSGPIISLGYYKNEEATRKSFIQNPLNKFYREIIYKTGDLGKLNEKGEFEFCGRIDRQIKLMGHRIELEELESIGKKIHGVMECVCVFDKVKSILYFVYTGNANAREVALYFRKVLPAYMVPRKIILTDEICKLPNGKIDIKKIEKEYIK